MDTPVATKVEPENTESPASDPTEITHEEMREVAGGQNGAGAGPPH